MADDLRRVHNTTQGLALRRVSRALTLVATHWNARIDSDPISAFPCVRASDQNILTKNMIFSLIANLTQRNARPCVNIVNPPLLGYIATPTRARSIHTYVLVLAFSISLSLSDGTLDGMPALVKNRYSDMVSSNKILHLLACTSKNS